jgi:hypothetical protein
MSNGYLVAATADIAAAREISEGFGLDVIDASTVGDPAATAEALAAAANVGILLSANAAEDTSFVALAQALAGKLPRAQLILVDSARDAFAFLPAEWPAMSLDDARARAAALAQQQQTGDAAPEQTPEPAPPAGEPPSADATPEQPAEPAPAPQPQPEESQRGAGEAKPAPTEEPAALEDTASSDDLLGGADEQAPDSFGAPADESAASGDEPAPEAERMTDQSSAEEDPAPIRERAIDTGDAAASEPPAPPASATPPEEPPAPKAEEPVAAAPPPAAAAPEPQPAPPPQAEPPAPPRRVEPPVAPPPITEPVGRAAPATAPSAPADATAFAPKKLRRGTPELVRIVVHQPKDLNAVIKAAKKIDPRTDAAPSGMSIGDVALGASIGIALEVRGAACDGALQRRTWAGEPIDFSFSVEADPSVKQVVLLARVFINDAQIGVLAFTRNVSGPAKKPHSLGDRVRLKRHKRVFLSYSSKDRETVATIATAYQMAGVDHFWDRTSLKSGETWHPRLRREIDRADLFHLCWSRAAAESEWVKKEAEHAITRRKRHSGKPEITVQMLDGPPWAKHPDELDSINFDDFVRAAIVGYARGDGSS